MKNNFKKSIWNNVLLLALIAVVFTSCNNNEDTALENNLSSEDITNATTQTEIETVSDGVNSIVENIYFDFDSGIVSKKNNDKKDSEQRFFPDCLTITKVITDGHKKITLDYGDGCTTRNDNYLSGKIIIEFERNMDDKTVVIDYTFDNFYFNAKKVEGEVHKVRTKENENGNPQAVINRDIKITWEDESSITIKGERKREWIEGFGNRLWGDNVFLITGTWTTVKKDGTERTVTVIKPLTRKMACRFLVSGSVEIQKDNNTITLDYGDGTCDDLATITNGDQTREIHLKKRRRRNK